MDEATKLFILVIAAIALTAVSIYSLIIKVYERKMEKSFQQAQEILAKTANLNLRVDVQEHELFKRKD
jgi:predicted amino acid-binding ACT domain protein